MQGTEAELTEAIQKLEEENLELNKQIKQAIEASNNNLVFRTESSMEFSSPEKAEASSDQKETVASSAAAFDADFSQMNSVEDPFQTYDPFKESSSDPFKDNSDPNDPFASAALPHDNNDPFASNTSAAQASGFEVDPFGAPVTSATAAVPNAFGTDPFGTSEPSTAFGDDPFNAVSTDFVLSSDINLFIFQRKDFF